VFQITYFYFWKVQVLRF